MLRILFVAATALALLVCAAEAYQGGELILDKKDKLTKDDPGWQPKAKGDPVLKYVTGNPHKVYTLKFAKGDKLVIRMKSVKEKEIDPLVAIEDSKKNILAFNDDDPDFKGKDLNSKLEFTIPADGEYRIIATVTHELIANKFGDFTLTVQKDKK